MQVNQVQYSALADTMRNRERSLCLFVLDNNSPFSHEIVMKASRTNMWMMEESAQSSASP